MQFLRKGATKLESFVYHFVENLKLMHDKFQKYFVVRSDHGVIARICVIEI